MRLSTSVCRGILPASLGRNATCRTVHRSVQTVEVKQVRYLCSLIVLLVINTGFSTDTTNRKYRDKRAIKPVMCFLTEPELLQACLQ
jgi:hypothetical protein